MAAHWPQPMWQRPMWADPMWVGRTGQVGLPFFAGRLVVTSVRSASDAVAAPAGRTALSHARDSDVVSSGPHADAVRHKTDDQVVE